MPTEPKCPDCGGDLFGGLTCPCFWPRDPDLTDEPLPANREGRRMNAENGHPPTAKRCMCDECKAHGNTGTYEQEHGHYAENGHSVKSGRTPFDDYADAYHKLKENNATDNS